MQNKEKRRKERNSSLNLQSVYCVYMYVFGDFEKSRCCFQNMIKQATHGIEKVDKNLVG